MRATAASCNKLTHRAKAEQRRPSVGIRELKAKVSAIVEDVKRRRVTYAVTKRGHVEALIVPVDAGERLVGQPKIDSAWEVWQTLVGKLAKESRRETRSALAELEQMRR